MNPNPTPKKQVWQASKEQLRIAKHFSYALIFLSFATFLPLSCTRGVCKAEDPACIEFYITNLLNCQLGGPGCQQTGAGGSDATGGTGGSSGPTTFALPDSGQTTCSSGASGNSTLLSCPQTVSGQDGDYANVPNAWSLSITDGGDTITDATSGFIWQRCSKGQTGSTCTGTATSTDNQATAASYCSGLTLAGKTWRLPSIRELLLFPDYNIFSPSANASYFPNQPGTGVPAKFWTSTAYAPTAGNFWYVDMNDAQSNSQTPGTGSYTRCVSGLTMPAASFTDKGDGTILDATTNLLFTKCSNNGSGTPLSGAACASGGPIQKQNWMTALAHCEALTFAGRSDWRLPSVRELATIVKYNAGSAPYIDATFFPNTPASTYWSSTTVANGVTNAWRINFTTGMAISGNSKSFTAYVRCVATGP